MRAFLFKLCLGLLLVSAAAPFAKADTISFQASKNKIRVNGLGKGTTALNLFLGACGKKACQLTGLATGPIAADSGKYTFKTNGRLVLSEVGGLWVANVVPGFATFCFGKGCGLLAGEIAKVTFDPSTGVFNFVVRATGGSLMSLFAHGKGDLLTLSAGHSGINLSSLVGTKHSVAMNMTGGALAAVSEPSSMVLLGSGLLAIAGIGRRRLWLH